MRPSARSTEELGSGLTSVRRCAPVVAACTLLRSGIGLERHGRRLLGLVAFRGFLRRVDDHLHASGAAGRACAGGRVGRFRDLALHVVGDLVGGDLVVVALHARAVVELEHVVAVVELRALGEALDPLVGVVALLAEHHRRAVRHVELVAILVLAHRHLVGGHAHGALRDHHVAFERGGLVVLVARPAVGADDDFLLAVAALGRRGKRGRDHGGEEYGSHHLRTGLNVPRTGPQCMVPPPLSISTPFATARLEGLSRVTSASVLAIPASGSTTSFSVVTRAASFFASASRTMTTLPSIRTRPPPRSNPPTAARLPIPR